MARRFYKGHLRGPGRIDEPWLDARRDFAVKKGSVMGIAERSRLGGKAPPDVAVFGEKPRQRSLTRP